MCVCVLSPLHYYPQSVFIIIYSFFPQVPHSFLHNSLPRLQLRPLPRGPILRHQHLNPLSPHHPPLHPLPPPVPNPRAVAPGKSAGDGGPPQEGVWGVDGRRQAPAGPQRPQGAELAGAVAGGPPQGREEFGVWGAVQPKALLSSFIC